MLNRDLLDRLSDLLDIVAKKLMMEEKSIYSKAPDNQKGSGFRMKLSLKLTIRMRCKVASLLSCPKSASLAEELNRGEGISHSMLICYAQCLKLEKVEYLFAQRL